MVLKFMQQSNGCRLTKEMGNQCLTEAVQQAKKAQCGQQRGIQFDDLLGKQQ